MSKTLGFLTSAALMMSVGAFAQSSTTAPSPNAAEATPPAAAPAPEASSEQAKPMKAHHRHHMHEHAARSGKGAASDWDAEKLNACMPDANPTPQQLACMRQAENAPS